MIRFSILRDYEPIEPPAEEPLPICPVCGQETDTFKLNFYGEVCGCDLCVVSKDAWDWEDEHND